MPSPEIQKLRSLGDTAPRGQDGTLCGRSKNPAGTVQKVSLKVPTGRGPGCKNNTCEAQKEHIQSSPLDQVLMGRAPKDLR